MATDALTLDVAVIGGGLAGNLAARQLIRAHPELSVGLFERSAERSFKVGESTVELASHYLIRRLGLSGYLYQRQLPKNGLRFFFDNAEKSAALESMSEIGSVALPYLPSFQIDRARMEADLLLQNQRDGVQVMCPSKVSRLRISDGVAPHRFESSQGPVEARWLLDASGRASLVAKAKGLRVPASDHPMAAVWGRFRGVRDLDDFGPAAFHGRVKHTSRLLSTNHLCYPGYWIWFIPLGEGITSVGVVIEGARFDERWRSAEGFTAFLRKHRAAAQLLEGAELVDVMSYGQLAYGTKRFFDAGERWALIGEAGAFTDPLYSPGSDFIALENDYACDLIARDRAGEKPAELGARAELYDRFMQYRFESTMLLYRSLYSTLGSYALFGLKWDFDIACYYNLWLEPYMLDRHLDAAYLREQLRLRKLVAKVLTNFAALFERVEAHLRDAGRYDADNLGAFTGDFPTMACQIELGSAASAERAIERTAEAFNLIRRRALALLDRPELAERAEALPIKHFLAGKPLLPELGG